MDQFLGVRSEVLRTKNLMTRWMPLAEALPWANALLSECERHLGRYDSNALRVRLTVDSLIGNAGDPIEALRRSGKTLADCEKHLAPDHGTTLLARRGYGVWVGAAVDPMEGHRWLADLLATQVALSRRAHPQPLQTRLHMARLRKLAGDMDGAREELAGLAHDCDAALTPRHELSRRVRAELDRPRSGRHGRR